METTSFYLFFSFICESEVYRLIAIIKECSGWKDELSPRTGGLYKPCEVASKHPIVFTAQAPSLLLWRDRELAETKQAAAL